MSEDSKKVMTTKEAFQYFVNNIYPDIPNKEGSLRTFVSRFKSNESVSEDYMENILKEHFKETTTTKIVKGWEVN